MKWLKDSHDTKYCAQKGGSYENNLKGARLAERLAQQQRDAAKTQSSLANHMKRKEAGKEDSDEDSSESRVYGCFANFKASRKDESASENDSDEWEGAYNEKHGRVRKRVRFADDDGELMDEDIIDLVSDESSESYDQHDEEMLQTNYEDEVSEISNLKQLDHR